MHRMVSPRSSMEYRDTGLHVATYSTSAETECGTIINTGMCLQPDTDIADRAGIGSDGNPVLVQRFHKNLSRVFVVRVEVEDVPHHVGQTLAGEFLWFGRRWEERK
ncbi:hypothetical protein EYF80_010758 [Liparis tanakae]|uniref:Uncharacterized protein n=1 Tax=Liparis tanakae TaxID=230148 RepID=A0A4Z2IM28_9TELE|nr:hypothetical protein EYF80_010758 [Liparis tanakae]